jgi:hypothetical protein
MLEVLLENSRFEGKVIAFDLAVTGREVTAHVRRYYPGWQWIQSRELPQLFDRSFMNLDDLRGVLIEHHQRFLSRNNPIPADAPF